MLSNTLQDAINDQISKEFYSSYLYLSMAAYFENKNLPGFAQWMYVQADEERGHGMRLFEHVIDRGGRVVLKALAAPESDWKTNLDLIKQVQQHEAAVTASINALYELAVKENDYPCQVVLHWFITEQVEEEKNALELRGHLELVESRNGPLLMLDHRLGKRGKE